MGKKQVCRQCGYDLFGNMSGVCPECGLRCESTFGAWLPRRWHRIRIVFILIFLGLSVSWSASKLDSAVKIWEKSEEFRIRLSGLSPSHKYFSAVVSYVEFQQGAFIKVGINITASQDTLLSMSQLKGECFFRLYFTAGGKRYVLDSPYLKGRPPPFSHDDAVHVGPGRPAVQHEFIVNLANESRGWQFRPLEGIFRTPLRRIPSPPDEISVELTLPCYLEGDGGHINAYDAAWLVKYTGKIIWVEKVLY